MHAQSHYHAEKGIRKKEKAAVLYKIDIQQTAVMEGLVWSTNQLIPTQEFLFSTTSKLTSPLLSIQQIYLCATQDILMTAVD